MGPGGGTLGHLVSQDPVAQMNTFRSYVSMLADSGSKDENKLKAAQALSEDLEAIVASPQYPAFLEHAMKIFIKILSEGDPLFISEYNIQQLRKLILEMIHRLPSNEQLKVYLRQILSLMFRLLETDNEENVMVCLRIIIELHKTFRPQFSPEIQQFLQFVKNMYRDLPNHMSKIFEPRSAIRVSDLSEVNVDALLKETFSITPIHTEKKLPDSTPITYNLIPRAVLSLKVLTELPIIVVLMFQLYKQQVYQDVADFIPLIMNTIILQPYQQHREHDSFNKEVFVDLIAAQIKTLSFLAYILKIYQDVVAQHSAKLVSGMLTLLALCPNEVAHLRKELLIATKHILALELRNRFVPHIDRLFDESLLFGRGWTAHETLRPLAYSTLADLVHHVRQQLDMGALTRAVHLFSKNIHDETLPTSIQTMSCKLLLNLVDCIRTRSDSNHEPGAGRDLLIRMLHVFVNKFKTIAQLQLPFLKNKQQQQLGITSGSTTAPLQSHGSTASSSSCPVVQEDRKEDVKFVINEIDNKDKEIQRIGFPPNVTVNYSVSDCRALVKTLVCGVKTITWGCASCKSAADSALTLSKSFHPKETLVFIRLVKWAMQALDIYTLNAPGNQQQATQKGQVPQTVRSKEEKEVLEHFAGVFIMMNPSTFREIFSTTIDYVVERIYHNTALQIVANSFLANSTTSPIFATILVEYLLGHMEEMGTSMDRSNLYLKLFKLVFGSVSLFAAENEQMLKPHLHQIVNRSMELAMSAKDPYNYFLLLRALFRSIGGGSHDLLYQEFLPLLPTLLQGLNSLQSGLHKQHMKDLFVELCLTVPVRLSSLLPYLPMLMDPLVSALNGSQTLISQGLRTLELCVDNLQPDFLYEHIQPVRAELMQALWKTLRNPNDTIAQVAFRVLGKFGGGNRKMMIEPQKLEYSEQETPSTCVTIQFSDHKSPITLPVEKIIETAFTALKTPNTEPWYRRQCWEVIRCFLIGSMQFDEEKHLVNKLFTHPTFREGEISTVHGPYYKCQDEQARQVHQMAVTAMFVAAAIKDLRQSVLPTMVSLVRHYTMVAIAQQAGPFNMMGRWSKVQGMDPLVLIDALAVIMGHEEKELCKPGHLALVLIMEAATNILGTKERACQLPLMEYLVEKMCGLCYERAWYAKLGGCIAIKFLFERMALKWVLEHQFPFLRALLFVMMDLTGEVSSGAVDMAKNNLERMLKVCASPLEGENNTEDMKQIQNKSLHDVTHELVRQVTSPNTTVREQAMQSLHVLAKLSGKGVTEVMQPHKDVLADMIPPKKHPLRQQPANVQIGLMDGNTFCTTLEPRLFTLDLNMSEHQYFYNELLMLVETEDSYLAKLSCYKNIANLVPLRKSALKALAACHYIPQIREKIFPTLYKALNNSSHPELQETAFECLKKFQSGCQIDMEMVHAAMRPLLGLVCHYRSVTLPVIHHLSYLTQLFPYTFNEKLCEQLTQHVKNLIEVASLTRKQNTSVTKQDNSDLKLCANIIGIFHQIPAASSRFVEVLCKLVLQTERALMIEAGSPFREPLMKFLMRYPRETADLFLSDPHARDQQWARYLEYLVRHKDNAEFRQHLELCNDKLLTVLRATPSPPTLLTVQAQQPAAAITPADKAQLQYLAIRITLLLARMDDQWIASHSSLVAAIRNIWVSDEFQERHHSAENTDFVHWKEPRMVVSILLMYFKHHTDDIRLLFELLRAFIGRFIPDFQFLRDFLEQEVAQTYSVKWKRSAFFKFVDVFEDVSVPQELKARILQYIIIPCLTVSMESGDGEKLIGYPPAPDQDHTDNVVSVFINRVINPDEPFVYSDAVRILLLQLSCLLVEQASAHIHDAGNKKQGQKLRRLMTFAWPCLLSKNCVDPATKYHGHLLLSHIIAKFAIHKRIVLQVFHSLLKAHAMEARSVVRQALEILTPAMPVRMEDGNTILTHWTRKILVEEGHSVGQLVHILQLVVRHANVYYPVRHHLTHHITQAMHRLGFTPTANLDQRRLAVDLAEVCIKWEEQRVKEEADSDGSCDTLIQQLQQQPGGIKRSASTDGPDAKRARVSIGSSRGSIDVSKPMEKTHADAVVYFLLRLACQVNESTTTPGTVAPGEALSRRCVSLLKRALKPDMWPHADPKLAWLDKLFLNLESSQPNLANVCVGLEVLTYLIGTLRREQILSAMRNLTRGLVACMTCSNSRVVRLTHSLLARLMSTFPTEPTSANVASRFEELEDLYSKIGKIVLDGLTSYEKNASATPTSLFGTLMILKAACQNNTCYIDRLIMPFMKVLQRMARDHLGHTATENCSVGSELLILSLDLVKNRVGVMGVEMRKAFIGTILVGLIEKTPDVKVMKAITKMVEEWVKNKTPIAINQGPSLREKSILLVKLMQYVEKRFSDDMELMAQFLELVNHVYRDDTLRNTELTAKLEPAFLAGLRCTQPPIRARFFQVFHDSMRARLHDRLLYIICSQNWDHMGPHYWIKQCIQLLLVTSQPGTPVQNSSQQVLLPGVTSVISWADAADRANFNVFASIKEEASDLDSAFESSVEKEDEIDIELSSVPADGSQSIDGTVKIQANPKANLHQLLSRQAKFMEGVKEVCTTQFLSAVAELCHMDTNLAEWVWLQLFPRIWKVLSEKQQQGIASEVIPFLCSGSHVIQKDCHPSALHTFTEALAQCQPPVTIRPAIMKYLGKSHNLWHRMTLLLEQLALDQGATTTPRSLKKDYHDSFDLEPVTSPQQEVLDSLSEMYSLLKEEDLWAGLWQTIAHYPETRLAVTYEQHGFLEQAQATYELSMFKAREDMAVVPAPGKLQSEMKLWEERWIRCAKELNQWDLVQDYGSSEASRNPLLVLESAWRVPNWACMKEALAHVEQSYPKELAWKINLYRGYLAICHPEEEHLKLVEKLVEAATVLCIREWKRLPHIVSHIHLPYLQAAQQVMELQEACQIHQGLVHGRTNSLHDMKAIVKTWRNRLPVIADDLSHWSDIFTWRQHHYQFIVDHYTDSGEHQSMLGVHASAQAIIHFGKIARKHNLSNVCLESLSRIHTIPSVPVVDCFQKIRQQVKCYHQMAMATGMGKNELQGGLEVIESTNLKFFNKDMTAEFYALKGMFLSLLNRSDEANKALSAAVQLHDTLVKAWALWGDYLEALFTRDPTHVEYGVYAITCYLHASRHQNESKSRKYLAKVLWLLSYDNEAGSLSEAVDRYCVGVPAIQWLPWIPQLLTCLVRPEGKVIINLLNQVGRMFPQAVYFPIRTLYLTLKIEQRGRIKSDPAAVASQKAQQQSQQQQQQQQQSQTQTQQTPQSQQQPQITGQQQASETAGSIKATEPMWRCSRIMHMQKELHPTVLASLEGIVDQMVCFREYWDEVVLRQLRQALAKCYAVAFENSGAVSEANITPHTLSFVKKLVSTFGIGIENISSSVSGGQYASAASESLARRAQATVQDPVFHKMKGQFTTDFDFIQLGAMKLHNLIHKLKKWIKILEARVKLLPKWFLIEEKCRYLSNFSLQTAEVELPGEFLLPKHSHYYIRIARFMPRVDIVQKHGTAARRLHIRGHNGRVYPYLVVNDYSLSDARREERVLQLLRMLNHFFAKQKETSRRLVNLSVSRVVAVSPQMRLVEDNVSSLSLLDIYKVRCAKRQLEPDTPVTRYYERLASVQARGSQASHQVLRDIVKDVQNVMVPRTMLRDWALTTYPNPTHYWTFRKILTVQLALIGLMEYLLHLTKLYPDMMYVHQDSGLINVAYFKFNIDDAKGELDGNRPVPFRLTPNLAELVTSIGVSGPFTASMVATARCLATPSFKVNALLRAIMRDEIISWHKFSSIFRQQRHEGAAAEGAQGSGSMEGEALITRVNKAVTAITTRIQSLASSDGADNKVTQLVRAVNCVDNLCRMDPAWHPWL